MVNMKSTIKKVEAWLRKPGNTKAKLCSVLGYRTTATIDRWFQKGEVPRIAEQHVLKALEENK